MDVALKWGTMFRSRSRSRIQAACLLAVMSTVCGSVAQAQTAPASMVTWPDLGSERHAKQFPSRSLFLDAIRSEARAHELPAAIADAVVRVESGYNPSALGGVGEVGLMQVRPTTAAMLGFKGTDAELAVPETNIRYGVAYLAKAWRLAGGDLCRALMKYRAGHGEETMSPLSVEYCRRAQAHLATLGWIPERGSEPQIPGPTLIRAASTVPLTPKPQTGPKLISVASSGALLAANRARMKEAWRRISVMQ
jgi:soluble lytic murein transglycosylase-like protein